MGGPGVILTPGVGGAGGKGVFMGDGGEFSGFGGAATIGSGPGDDLGESSGDNWMSALNEAGCAPGAFVVEAGPPGANGTQSVGDGGGYGGIYCFALTP
jgi:hypothetical protein